MRIAFLARGLSLPTIFTVFVGCLPATNPFDPSTPADQQQPARVTGTVVDAVGPVGAAAVAIGDVTTETAADGTYTLTAVTPGVATLVVSDAAHDPFEQDLILIAGGSRTVDVKLAPLSGPNAGHVTGVARKGLEVGKGDQADFSGIVVEVEGLTSRTTTNAAGTYDLDLAPGSYQLNFSAPEHISQFKSDVVVASGETTTVETLTLAANPGSVSGTVTLDPEIPGAASHGSVQVSIHNTSVTTAADDAYSITGLTPGPTVLRFTRDGWVQAEVPVVIVAGILQTVDEVHLKRATGSVAGFVSINGFSDHSGVTVIAHGSAGTFTGASAPDGSFFIAALPTGTYDIEAVRQGFIAADGGVVDVTGDATTQVNDAAHPMVLTAQIGDFLINAGDAFTNDPTVTLTITTLGTPPAQMLISQSNVFTGVTPQVFDPNATFALTGSDGTKTVFVELVDGAGAVTGPFQASIVLDRAPPSNASITLASGAAFSNNTDGLIPVTPFASDDVSGVSEMQIAIDGDTLATFQAFSTAVVLPIVPNSDGDHTFTVVFRDRAGNASAPVTSTITLDRTPPQVGRVIIVSDGGSTETPFAHSPVVQVFIDPALGSEDAVAMALSTDASFPTQVFQALSSPTSFFLAPGEGTQGVSVKLKDAAGNISQPLTDTIVVDTKAPTAASVLLGGGAALVKSRLAVALDLSAQGATLVRVSFDGVFDATGADYSDVATFPTTIDLLAGDGDKTVFAQFADDAGNESDVVKDTITLDTTAPVLGGTPVSINAAATFTQSVSVTVGFNVTGADLVAIAVDGAVDTESAQPFSQFVTVLLPASQTSVCTAGAADCRRVCAKFSDTAGNTTAQQCDEITLDATVPSAPLIVENDSVVSATSVTLHLVHSAQDAHFDHFEVLVDPGVPSFIPITFINQGALDQLASISLTAPTSVDPLTAAQPNVIRLRAVDGAGNVSPESAVTFIVDTVAPDAPALADPIGSHGTGTGITNDSTVSVNFLTGTNLADKDATFDHYKVKTSLIPAPFDSFQRDAIIVELLPDQLNTIDVTAVDAAGNESPTSSIRVVQDSAAPFAPIISPSEGTARGGPVEISLLSGSIDAALLDATACNTSADCTGSQVCADRKCTNAVLRYQLKDGNGEGFKEVGATGPFLAFLKPGRDTDVCVRGVDNAGNIGIEECAVIHEASRTQIAINTDHPHGSDVFGDILVFGGGGGSVILRDLSGSFADQNLIAGHGELSPNGDIDLGGDGAHVFAVWQTNQFQNGNPASAIIQLDFTAPQPDGSPTITRGVFSGSSPSVDANTIVYVNQGRVRDRNTVVPPDFVLGTTVLDVNPADAGNDISGAVTLCNSTEPRIGGGVEIWCESPVSSITNLKRRLLSNGATATIVSGLDVVRGGSLISNLPATAIQQPVVSGNMIAWASAASGLQFLDITNNPGASTTGIVTTTARTDALAEADGFVIGTEQKRTDGLTNDVAFFELGTNPISLGSTNDVSPQGDVTIDDGRMAYGDSSQGETLELIDASTTRWINPAAQLAFEPATSTTATAWIQGIDNRIGLVARLLPIEGNAVVTVDSAASPVSFFGPSHSDPAFGVGGRRNASGAIDIARVAFLTGTTPPLTLSVRDLVTGQVLTISNNVGFIDNGTQRLVAPIAIDPDGDDVVFVDAANNLIEVSLPTPLVGVAPVTRTLDGSGPIIMVDVDDGMIVAQRGGDVDRESGTTGAGALVCSQGGVHGAIPGAALERGPKVAHTAASGFLLGFSDGTTSSARGCFLTCSAAPTCTQFAAGFAGTGRDTHVQVSRSGYLAYLNDFTLLNEVVIFDPFSHHRRHLTSDNFDRSGISVAGNRLTYADASLGGAAIFEIER